MSCGLPLPAQPGDATQALDLTAAAMRANPSIASTATIRRLHKGGGLFSHAADLNALFRRVAEFVDRSAFLIECDQVRQPPQGKLEDALIELQMFRVMDRRPPFILSICVWITPETRSPLSAIRARPVGIVGIGGGQHIRIVSAHPYSLLDIVSRLSNPDQPGRPDHARQQLR